MAASRAPPTGALARGPGVRSDRQGTHHPLVRRPTPSLLSHTSQGYFKASLTEMIIIDDILQVFAYIFKRKLFNIIKFTNVLVTAHKC